MRLDTLCRDTIYRVFLKYAFSIKKSHNIETRQNKSGEAENLFNNSTIQQKINDLTITRFNGLTAI